jgi:hypothetical protein
MDVLPKTFQDAIIITQRLASRYGVRFLWIDPLCILQDPLEDWNEEAPRMVEVFRNCWCNIAATHAPDRRTGLFASRDPTKLLPIFLKLRIVTVMNLANTYVSVHHVGRTILITLRSINEAGSHKKDSSHHTSSILLLVRFF